MAPVENGGLQPASVDWNTLKVVGSYLGIIGTGGGGFAALSFGLGYLAVKNHDEMVGLPSTAVSSTVYVRTGALFFPKSLYYLFSSAAIYVFIAAAAAFVVWLATQVGPSDRWFHKLGDGAKTPVRQTLLFVIAQLALLLGGFYLLHLQVAVFDSENKGLLFYEPNVAVAPPSAPTLPGGRGRLRYYLKQVQVALALQQKSELAPAIRRDLQSVDGEEKLQARYGHHLALLILLSYGVVATRRWRRKLTSGVQVAPATVAISQGSRSSMPIDWVLQPLLYGILAAAVVNIPATYGILCLPNAGTWVDIVSDSAEPESGYLLSDLSAETKEIWLLGYEPGTGRWVLKVFERDKITQIQIIEANNTGNILAKESRGS